MFSFLFLQIGRTEQIKNTLDPQFSKAILIEYYFEEVQKLKILVHDIDSESGSLSSADFLGGLECTLAQVCSILVNNVNKEV